MGKSQVYEHLPARSLARANAMISSLFQALNLVVTERQKSFSPFFTGPGCRQVWSCVHKSVPALHADILQTLWRHLSWASSYPEGVSPVSLSSYRTGF